MQANPSYNRGVLEQVAREIQRHGMFSSGERAVVAVSGGADSVALLHVLLELRSQLGIRLSVAHLNHQLRGPESDADERFVTALAAGLGLPFHCKSLDVRGLAEQRRDNLEQTARLCRYQWFTQLTAAGHADKVAVGHTLNDQAETVLLRLLRGSGSAGLSAISPVRADGVVRPLLGTTREQVVDFLRARQVEWREDATNFDLSFDRNRLRHQLMPLLTREWNPNLSAVLARTAEWARDEEAYWNETLGDLTSQVIRRRRETVELSVNQLAEMPVAVVRRVLRQAAAMTKGNLRGIGWDHIEQLRRLAQDTKGSGAAHLPGLEAVRSFDTIRLRALPANSDLADFSIDLHPPDAIAIPGSSKMLVLRIADRSDPQEGYNSSKVEVLDWERVPKPLRLRNWRPGDCYRPRGRPSAKKLKALFQENRTPIWERAGWPVLTSSRVAESRTAGDVLVWTRVFGGAADFEPRATSRRLLRITEVDCGGLDFVRTDPA